MSQGVHTCARTGFPTVSVIIPAYNSSTTIAETLRSIFGQSRSDFEIVVVDDGSADREALQAAVSPWSDAVQLALMQPNRGAGAARNRALSLARGKYVAFLDSDDTWMPGFLEAQLGHLERRPDCDMVWSDGWISGESGHAGRRYLESTESVARPSFASLLAQTCTVLTSAVVARKAPIDAAGGFDETLRRGQDFDLWLRLAHRGAQMHVLNEPLVVRRVVSTGLSGDTETQLRRVITVLLGIARKLPLDAEELAILHQRLAFLNSRLEIELAKQALRDRDVVAARSHLQQVTAISSWKISAARLALRVAPGLVREAYAHVRPAGRQASTPRKPGSPTHFPVVP
jgi:glycosyltransferase involved in cell wall biosynthesis